MRVLFLFFLLFWTSAGYGQEFTPYQDSLYSFKIGIPAGWRYGKPKTYPDLLLIGIRQTSDTTEKVVENFNVSVVRAPNSSLDTTFSRLLKYNSLADDYAVVQKGATTISEQNFRWVISTHTNKYNAQLMYNYVFMTYDGARAYILTMVSTPKNFETYRPLFEKIAQTFVVKNAG